MRSFVLTGGIGAGKSSVLRRLVELGARSIDADETVRELQKPGQEVFDQIVDRFGNRVLTSTGQLDRAVLADIVFGSDTDLADLEAIVHPAVRNDIARRLSEFRTTQPPAGSVIVVDIPLVTSTDDLYDTDGVIVVDCPIDTVIERLVTSRGFTADAAKARIERQISRAERLNLADFVVDNGGSMDRLEDEIQRCWEWIASFEDGR